MKIVVRERETKKISIWFPTGLALNSLTGAFMAKALQKEGIHISRQQAKLFVKEINRYRRRHRDWKLVEVQSAHGEFVQVKI